MIFHAFLHACQVDQVKHLIPVYGMMGADRICGILDCLFHQLHLFDTVTYRMGQCGKDGVSVKIDDEVYSVTEEDVEMFVEKKILPLA